MTLYIDKKKIYQNFFHILRFQVIDNYHIFKNSIKNEY